MTLSGPGDGPSPDGQAGFTLVEMVVAMTLMAGVLLSMAAALFGAMNGLVASRQRSSFIEIANAEMENLRSLSYDMVAARQADTVGANSIYAPGAKYQGRDAVVSLDPEVPASVTTVTSSPVKGIVLPYTVRRWVTWTDTFGGTSHQFKRINVEVEWKESGRSVRKLMLTSLLYPGGGAGVDTTNQAPTAVIAPPSPAAGPPLTSFSFNGTGSSDPDPGDTLTTYSWNFGDGTTATGSTVNHVYATAGTYTVTLTVVDSKGKASSPATRNVGVGTSLDNPPAASFNFGPASGTAPLTATFTSTSTDGEGPISTWDWDWGDGTAHGATEQATHVFQSAGTFTVRLTVTDSGGLSGTTTRTIQVNPLNCDVISGSLKNPSSNVTSNDVKVGSNQKPSNSGFAFYATTNAACTSVVARVPYSGGTLVVNLGRVSGTNDWTGSTTTSVRFNVANNQNATMTGSDGTSPDVFTYPFNVHR